MKGKKYIFLGIFQSIVGLAAIIIGLEMMSHPNGSSIGLSLSRLGNSPFNDFFYPGLLLFIVNGLFSITCSAFSFLKSKHAARFGYLLGTILVAWISVQVHFIGFFNLLQPIFFCVGIAEMLLSYSIIKQKIKNNIKIQV